MIEIVSKSGKRIGKISDDMSQDDILYVDGKPVALSDLYSDPVLFKKFNDEVKDLKNGIELQD